MSDARRPGFLRLAVKPFRDCFTFSGRSTRSEIVAFYLLTMFADAFVHPYLRGAPFAPPPPAEVAWALLWYAPVIALSIRRYHDQDRSAWWLLVPAAAVSIFAIAAQLSQSPGNTSFGFLVWHAYPDGSLAMNLLWSLFCISVMGMIALDLWPPSPGVNRYGPNPRPAPAAPAVCADHEPAA